MLEARILLLPNDLHFARKRDCTMENPRKKKGFVSFSDLPKILRHILRNSICFRTLDTCVLDIDIVLAKAET